MGASEKLKRLPGELLHLATREVGLRILENQLAIDYPDASEEHLREAHNLLRQDNKRPPHLILYANHTSHHDAKALMIQYYRALHQLGRSVIIPVSHYLTETDKKFREQTQLGERVLGYRAVPLIQSHQVGVGREYTRDEGVASVQSFLTTLIDTQAQSPNSATTIIIFPEGHRSEDGQLGEGHAGIVRFAHTLCYANDDQRPVIFLPTGIIYPGEGPIDREGLNKHVDVTMNVGKPIVMEDVQKRMSFDPLMHALADLLPYDMQGVYAR